MAAGLVLVAIDLRTRSADFLPDMLGWLLVAGGAWMVGAVGATVVTIAAAALSLSELVLPYHLVRFDRETGTVVPADTPGAEDLPLLQRWDDLSALHGVLIAAAAVAGAVGLVLLLRALGRRAAAEGDAASVRQLRLAARLAPVGWCAPYVILASAAVLGDGEYDPVWHADAEVLGTAAVVSLLVLAVFLALTRDRGWAVSLSHDDTSPWDRRRRSDAH